MDNKPNESSCIIPASGMDLGLPVPQPYKTCARISERPNTPFFYDRSSREWRKTCDQSIRPVLFSEMPNSFTSDGKETLFFPPDNLSGKINRFPGKKLVFTARNLLWRNRPGLRMPFRKTGQPINRLVSIRPEQRKRNLSQVVYRERVRRACAS